MNLIFYISRLFNREISSRISSFVSVSITKRLIFNPLIFSLVMKWQGLKLTTCLKMCSVVPSQKLSKYFFYAHPLEISRRYYFCFLASNKWQRRVACLFFFCWITLPAMSVLLLLQLGTNFYCCPCARTRTEVNNCSFYRFLGLVLIN